MCVLSVVYYVGYVECVFVCSALTPCVVGCCVVYGVLNLWQATGHSWAGQCGGEFTCPLCTSSWVDGLPLYSTMLEGSLLPRPSHSHANIIPDLFFSLPSKSRIDNVCVGWEGVGTRLEACGSWRVGSSDDGWPYICPFCRECGYWEQHTTSSTNYSPSIKD